MDLQGITLLANLMRQLEQDISDAEGKVSTLKERHRSIKEESLPMALQEMGVESITLTTGEKVTISQEVYASIPVASREAAYAWLDENGFGGLIKTEVSAQFDRGEQERAATVMECLEANGVSSSLSKSIHAQTLKAFLKEQLAASKEIPLDLFGARPVWIAKLKAPKQ